MEIKISDHFNYQRLIRFTMPSIAMMIFTSIYDVVDGFFVSNFVGKTPFAAVNFAMPILMLMGAVGFIFGTGGSALVAKTMGEGNHEKAVKTFSLLIYTAIILGLIIEAAGYCFMPKLLAALGAEGEMLTNCIIYTRIVMLAVPPFILQFTFQSFFITAEKPDLGFKVTIIAGVTNMVLDALFVAVLHFGIAGAAVATCISQGIGGIIPLIYFARKNNSLLRLTKTHFDGRALLKTCTNGISEFVSNLAMSIIGVLYNTQLLAYAGEDGVAAYGVIMYISFLFIGVFFGYAMGTAPLFSYQYGAQNHEELKNLLRRSFVIIATSSLVLLAAVEIFAKPLSMIFVGYDPELLELTTHAFRVYSISVLFAGLSIFGSSFFTALNNGIISAIISFLRTLVFEVSAILILPRFFGLDGIWSSVIVAEFAAAILTLCFIIGKREQYHYL